MSPGEPPAPAPAPVPTPAPGANPVPVVVSYTQSGHAPPHSQALGALWQAVPYPQGPSPAADISSGAASPARVSAAIPFTAAETRPTAHETPLSSALDCTPPPAAGCAAVTSPTPAAYTPTGVARSLWDQQRPPPAGPGAVAGGAAPGLRLHSDCEGSFWDTLFKASEHHNHDKPDDLDTMLEVMQDQLLQAHSVQSDLPLSRKTLAPEQRLKFRIQSLQQLGDQVLGPVLFRQMYITLKKGTEHAKQELLNAVPNDSILQAMVAHINQLLLCESLYYG
uniref:Uncharacterized protein n=1 Tax=Eutreptiella gymnastica TaxID=73025 RepID=A0A7S4G2Q5_9EUGL